MSNIILPPAFPNKDTRVLSGTRRVSLIGGNGAGKSRFMQEMIRLAGNRAYCLSALSASFPEREESHKEGSVDSLYRKAASRHTYMRTDAVSELDKLIYMVFADEPGISPRTQRQGDRCRQTNCLQTTKLDIIKRLWEQNFPGNRIMRNKGSLMFATQAGDDLITVSSLSQGEKTVLYYIAAVLYAMPDAVIFIDSPSLFIHPSLISSLWDSIESLRPDCTFVYDSVDIDFVSSRNNSTCIWVKGTDSKQSVWNYEIIRDTPLNEDIFLELAGSRKPVIFIEGDTQHSIDFKALFARIPRLERAPSRLLRQGYRDHPHVQ